MRPYIFDAARFAADLKAAREGLGLNLFEFAEMADVEPAAISAAEDPRSWGHSVPPRFFRMCELLGLDSWSYVHKKDAKNHNRRWCLAVAVGWERFQRRESVLGLASRAGVEPAAVAAIERGDWRDSHEVFAVCAALGLQAGKYIK